jgi:alpha-mannosidase
MSNNTQLTEAQIRSELGIPPIGDPRAQRVVILSQSSHLDWDWLLPFSTLLNDNPQDPIGYFGRNNGAVQPVNTIFTDAGNFLLPNGTANPAYYYSICEMGFLEGFAEKNPSAFSVLKQAGNNLRIVGGGITSPDNLLPNGECFIRNYLICKLWLEANLPGLPLNQSWLPDDFGHDSQLPVLMQALGFEGVGFARVPGSDNQGPALSPLNGSPSVAQSLLTNGVDIVWQAADGSQTVGHWMQAHYCQGDNINQGNSPADQIDSYFQTNKAASKTDYIFVPVGCDFSIPQDLPTFAAQYNQNPVTAGVWAVAATFDHYIQLINGFWQRQGNTPPTPQPFFPTPYWTGFYASRPGNKILHQAASRALLGAEVFGSIADALQVDAAAWTPVAIARRQAIQNGWLALTPSTHHDFITGTSVDPVYTGEQQPLLKSAVAIGKSALQIAVSEVATLIEAAPNENETPVGIFNQLGFNNEGLVKIPAAPGMRAGSVRTSSGGTETVETVQIAADGDVLFLASAPSLGYSTAYLSPANVPPPTDPTLSLTFSENANGTEFTLSNFYLTATITKSADWGIASLQDTSSGTGAVELIAAGQAGNSLAFYIDGGNVYRFGNETADTNFELDPSGQLTVLDAVFVETGPLRLRLRTRVQFTSKDGAGNTVSAIYSRDYTLVAGEPFLRMSLTGGVPLTAAGAPSGSDQSDGNPYSVMLQFPFADPKTGALTPVSGLSHGTTYHWESALPVPYWNGTTFLASHDFLLPEANSAYLAAIYHSSIPAWAIDENGVLNGCVRRNTPQNIGGSTAASDTGEYTNHYAIRMPAAVQDPSTGLQLRESLGFQTPLLGAYINVPTGTYAPQLLSYPATFSLASVTSGDALITAAKSAEADSSALVLRVYQPTNAPADVTVSLTGYANAVGQTLSALQVTALENEIAGQQSIPVTNGAVSFNAERALTTLLITS